MSDLEHDPLGQLILSSFQKSRFAYDLSHFGLCDITIATAAIRRIGDGAKTFNEVAGRIVRHLYSHCTDSTLIQPAYALVRLFRTLPFCQLDVEHQRFALRLLNDALPRETVKCLCLAASAGQQPEWNDPAWSQGHKAIPLQDISFISRFPMIGQMLNQFGAVQDVLCSSPPTILLDQQERSYNVFYVPEAMGSPHVPAQEDFVLKYGVRSVLGFGSPLPSGELFAVILFSKVAMTQQAVEGFRTIALAAKLALLPFDTFSPVRPANKPRSTTMSRTGAAEESLSLNSRSATLEQLLMAHERMVLDQAARLEVALQAQREQTDLLHALVSATDPSHGGDLFNALVYHLAAALKVPYAVVGEFLTDQEATGCGKTVAVWANGDFAPNFTFHMQAVPSAQLIRERSIFCGAYGQQRFPQTPVIKDGDMEGYLGIPIYGKSGVPIGLLAVLDAKPLQFETAVQSLLKLFASRAGAELERIRLERSILEERIKRATSEGDEQYHASFGQAAVGTAQILTSAGRFVHVNRRHCEIAGRSETEMLSSTFMDITHPDDLQPDLDNMQRLIAGDIPSFTMEKRYILPDGSLRWVNLTVLPTWKSGQKPEYHLAVIEDITARKQMEEALRESEARFHSLIEAIPQQVWTAQPDGTLDYVNQRVTDYFECQPNDLLGWKWQTVVHPDDLPACLGIWTNALSTGEPYEIEFRLRRACDSVYRWHLARALPVKDDSNRIFKWFGTNTDITEHKQAEEALRLNQQRYVRATAVGRVGVWELDVATGTYHGDENLKALFGYQCDKLSTDPYVWLGLVHPEDQSIAMGHWQSIIAGNSDGYHHELRMIRKDGTVLWTEVRGHAIRDATGRLTHLLGATVDITDRKRMEEELRRREQDLQSALDERERIGQDLHDGILQSLYAVGLGLEACRPLLKQHRKKAATTLVSVFDQSISQLNHVMTEVRNFIAGLESQVLQGGDFAAALRTMIQTVSASNPTACRVMIDEAAAQQLSTEQALHLMNLVREALSNSLRHSRCKRITVSLKKLSHSIRLAVSDDGRGFDTAAVSGIGHGLPNMAARARKMGGHFAVSSRVKHGTKVTVDLPK